MAHHPWSLFFDQLPGELDTAAVESSFFGQDFWGAATCLHDRVKTHSRFNKSYVGRWNCLWLVAGVHAVKSYRTVQSSIQKNRHPITN